MRVLKQLLLGLACLVSLPAAGFAQASITGVVKDSSGAVLPGATVEAMYEATQHARVKGQWVEVVSP